MDTYTEVSYIFIYIYIYKGIKRNCVKSYGIVWNHMDVIHMNKNKWSI